MRRNSARPIASPPVSCAATSGSMRSPMKRCAIRTPRSCGKSPLRDRSGKSVSGKLHRSYPRALARRASRRGAPAAPARRQSRAARPRRHREKILAQRAPRRLARRTNRRGAQARRHAVGRRGRAFGIARLARGESFMSGHSQLSGRVAVVTGAGRNIGRAIALELAAAGAAVVVNARSNRDEVQAVVREIEREGARALACLADVADAEAVEAMMAAAVERFGRIDILVNNAALRREQRLEQMSFGDWRE